MAEKSNVINAVNDAMISLYWGIGKKLTEEITGVNKLEYGKRGFIEISKRLSIDYGTGFAFLSPDIAAFGIDRVKIRRI